MSEGTQTATGCQPAACQSAVLRNNFVFACVRYESVGFLTRLWLCDDSNAGYIEIPSDQIERFEDRPASTPPPPAPPASAATTSEQRPPKDRIGDLIASAAARHQIDPDFVASVVKAESGFNSTAVSPKGAGGLMQLMPQTAAYFGVNNVLDPAANVEAGTKYLRQLLDLYDGDAAKALAAYNAGPARVKQYGGVPPYPETQSYVNRVINDYNRKKLQQQTPASTPPVR
jgi:soluble lytic murein transglycosylase-like protein